MAFCLTSSPKPRRPLTVLILLVAVLVIPAAMVPAAAAPAHAVAPEAPQLRPSSAGPLLIGHRGAAGVAPENTVAAFRAGRAAGVDFIETDVQLSADGVPFLFHDNTPARTTNVEEVYPGREKDPITSFTWKELRALEVGSSFGRRFTGARIPHLDDLARIANRRTGVYLEIKSPKNSPGIEALVARKLSGHPAWKRLVDAGKVHVLGFDASSNRRFAALAPRIDLQQLVGTVPNEQTLADWSGFADSVGTNYRTLTPGAVDRVHAAGLGLGVYTANSPEAITIAVDLGVDIVTGDFPQQSVRLQAGRPPFPRARGLQISEAVNDPPGDDVAFDAGEHVVIRNASDHAIDASGVLLRDAANNTLRVGAGYRIPPGGELRVHTGPGTNTATAYFNGGSASILNKGGDSVALWDKWGRLQDVFAN
ncbi:MAG: lamin tail domain-containing protein [Micrococcaceae bacterium]|nr:lamin tail domain-containing protein [Micrococcaceae bacterium]